MSRKRQKAKRIKQPKIAVEPQVNKVPKILNPPPNFRGGHIAWRFNAADKNGPFAWSKLDNPEEYKRVIERLTDFETMNERDLENGGCHAISLENLSDEAQKRLRDIQIDDIDELYSFRIRGKPRVFGVHRETYMRVLWYDPDHKVCPAPKKHT